MQKRQVLESMIEDKLLLKEAEEESIQVSHDEIVQQRDQTINMYIQQMGSREALEKELVEKYGTTLVKLKKTLYDQVREQFLKVRLTEMLKRKYAITKKEVEKFYLDYRDSLPKEKSSIHLAHIMKKIEPAEEIISQSKKRIEAIEEELLSGKSFETLAKEYSDDPVSAKNGGDLGFFQKGFLDKAFEKVAFALNIGETSKITRSRYGFHIIRLEERRGEKEIRVRHILVLVRPNTGDSLHTRDMLDSIRTLITADTQFVQCAKTISDDKLTKHKGGDLGWVSRENLSPAYKDAIAELSVGETSGPVLIGNAFHIFRILGQKDDRRLTLENDFEILREFASTYKLKGEIKNICNRIRKRVYIENRMAPIEAPEQVE
jgi:peptidyl-prolyl cis-trans isomerase SurA